MEKHYDGFSSRLHALDLYVGKDLITWRDWRWHPVVSLRNWSCRSKQPDFDWQKIRFCAPLLPLLSAHRSVHSAAVIASSETASCRQPARPNPPFRILPSIPYLPPNIPDACFLVHIPPLCPVLTTWRIW